MVKRERIVPGLVIQVVKPVPGQAGPSFREKLVPGDTFEVVSRPFTSGGLNLVKLTRKGTEESFDALYAFVTNYCVVAPTIDVETVVKTTVEAFERSLHEVLSAETTSGDAIAQSVKGIETAVRKQLKSLLKTKK